MLQQVQRTNAPIPAATHIRPFIFCLPNCDHQVTLFSVIMRNISLLAIKLGLQFRITFDRRALCNSSYSTEPQSDQWHSTTCLLFAAFQLHTRQACCSCCCLGGSDCHRAECHRGQLHKASQTKRQQRTAPLAPRRLSYRRRGTGYMKHDKLRKGFGAFDFSSMSAASLMAAL